MVDKNDIDNPMVEHLLDKHDGNLSAEDLLLVRKIFKDMLRAETSIIKQKENNCRLEILSRLDLIEKKFKDLIKVMSPVIEDRKAKKAVIRFSLVSYKILFGLFSTIATVAAAIYAILKILKLRHGGG